MPDFDDSNDTISGAIEAAISEHTGEVSSGDARAAEPPSEAAPGHETAREAHEPEISNRASSSEVSERPHRRPTIDGQDERQAEAAKPAKSTDPTTSWADRNQDTFRRLPPDLQTHITKLENDVRDNAALKAEYEPVAAIFKPHADKIKAAGTTPAALIEGWSKAETRLLDRNDRGNMVAEIMHAYGISPHELGISLQQMPRRIAAAQQQHREGTVKSVATALDTFSAAKGQDGKPLYPHFQEFEAKMTELAQAGVGAGKPHPERLAALYEAALWASPKHRQAEIAARDRARATNIQPRTRPNERSDRTIRQELEAAMR
jgi:hypothetical protein